MKDFVDASAFNTEQGNRARKLFAAVVLAALDDAIADDRKYGNGPEQIARWARSRDGREVLSCAGIDPNAPVPHKYYCKRTDCRENIVKGSQMPQKTTKTSPPMFQWSPPSSSAMSKKPSFF